MLPRFLALLLLLPAGGSAWAAERGVELLQPAESGGGLVLLGAAGRARVERDDGSARRLRLRRDEELTAIAETRRGWVAAGVTDRRGRRDLVVFSETSGGVERLPAPREQAGAYRARPVPLIERGDLVGMAWLEGDGPRSFAVRAAGWSGAAWDPPEAVSQPGPGSQSGLVGTVLADGSWLLVWSAFDGEDEDLVWSLRRGSGWSPPRRLSADNRVPDAFPTLVSSAGGALVAWNRWQGDSYDVFTARFQGGRWSTPRAVGGAGTLYPSLLRREGGTYLLFQHAWPLGWTALELGSEGRPGRRAHAPTGSSERPVLVAADRREVRLRWPGDETRSALWEAVP